MKLWKKDYELNQEIEKFTVGNDFILDKELVESDCIASIAHAKMLNKVGLIDDKELISLIKGLNEIIHLNKKDKFEIKLHDEDCHTAIENYLIEKHGNVGKKIHTARSRNDQILVALRLYEKKKLLEVIELINYFKNELFELIKKQGHIKLPGYTHMQKAMPTTIAELFGCFISSMEDNIKNIKSVFEIIDQNPLGTGAGFGIPLVEIDRATTTKLLGFSKELENPIYAQMSRGKFEGMIVNVLTQVMFDLNKLATDLITLNMDEFGFFKLPSEICTGSSIMPQKKNPDVLELVRAKYSVLIGEEVKIKSMVSNLISGYNRDVQETKEPLMNSFEITTSCLKIMSLVISKINVNEKKCENALTKQIYATEETYMLVKKGMPFRDAYKQIAHKYN